MTAVGYSVVFKELVGILLAVALGVWGGLVVGLDHPLFGLMLVCFTFGVGPLYGNVAARGLPDRIFHVSDQEARLWRALGVGIFGRVLDISGWNRVFTSASRQLDGTRSGLTVLERSIRGAMSSHAISFSIHIAAAVWAGAAGHPIGILWILLPAVVVHLYPVLLQRSLHHRIQPLR